MKNKKLLPILLLVLLAILALNVFGRSAPATPAATEAPQLTLVTVPPAEAPEETLSPLTEEPADAGSTEDAPAPEETAEAEAPIDEDGTYTSAEDVALYVHTYGHLPSNFITKEEAKALGWDGGSLEPYAPGKCIGGSWFGNYEGMLPKARGRTWTECDIDTLGARSRGAKRLIFSNDGLIYYTDDHYESFQLLYGEP